MCRFSTGEILAICDILFQLNSLHSLQLYWCESKQPLEIPLTMRKKDQKQLQWLKQKQNLKTNILQRLSQIYQANASIFNNIVTAIGSYTYTSLESTPILSLMFPQSLGDEQFSNIPRTLISNNSAIHLLDTSPTLILNAYPNYNVYQGVTLSNLTGTISFKGITAQVTAEPIKTYVNDHILNGASGSTQFIFNLTNPPNWATGKWFHQIKGQFIWGSIMFAIIVGILIFLFYKSQPQAYC